MDGKDLVPNQSDFLRWIKSVCIAVACINAHTHVVSKPIDDLKNIRNRAARSGAVSLRKILNGQFQSDPGRAMGKLFQALS